MRLGLGTKKYDDDGGMEPADVWVERTDVDEVHLYVTEGTELYLTLAETQELRTYLARAAGQVWGRRRR